MQLYKKLIEDYPETAEVAQELKSNVDAFSKNLPLIKAFTSDAITDEDWLEIQKVVEPSVGEDPFVQDEVKVSMFAEFDLYKYIEEIEEIEMRASKKAKLANQLKTQKDETKNFNLTLGEYKGELLKITLFDDINGFLDEQIVQTQQMLGSSFMKGRLKAETKTYEGKLIHMSELMDEILKVQKNWMYLEPIFGSGDIG
jgi:dynein heavy chain